MIGDEYLEVRAEVGTALAGLTQLGHDLEADPASRQTLHDLSRALNDPFLFVVVGEVKAGKSSLLNALFGRDFCKVDVLPATDKVYLFKYGEQEKNVHVSERLTECYRPAPFLQDFNIVDTPGTNTIVAEHQEITEEFIPRADLVLFVFSVVNPWAASAWEFLKLVHSTWLKNVVFVLQQSDLRSPDEVETVVKHLEETAQKQVGAKIPIFAVSAKKAFEAKAGRLYSGELADSRLPELEQYIDNAITEGADRLGKLLSVVRSGQVILSKMREKLASTLTLLHQDEQRLQKLSATLEERKKQSLRQIGGVLYALSQSYEKAQQRAEELLREKLSFGQTLKLVFRKADWQRDFQRDIEERLKDSFQRQIEQSLELLEEDLKSVWKQLHERLQEDFDRDKRGPATMPDFHNRRTALLKKIELTLLEKMSSRDIDDQMQRMFTETAGLLRVPAGVAAAAGGVAALAAALAQGALLDVTGTIAGIAAVFGAVVAVVKRRKILNEFGREMRHRREEVLQAIEDQLTHSVELFYQELGATFEPLRSFCATQLSEYQPKDERCRALATKLGALEERLRETAAS